MHWRLCSIKQRTGREQNISRDQSNFVEETTTSVFHIDIPQFGYFEKQMEFRTASDITDTVRKFIY